MDEDMGPDEQAQLSNDEDIGIAHIPKVNLTQHWWKPLEKERPATPEPTWSIPSSDVPVPPNNWASALASNYSPPPEDSLLAQTDSEEEILDAEVQANEAIPLSDEEIALDAASSEGSMSRPGSGGEEAETEANYGYDVYHGISEDASWHAKYKDSAHVYVGGIPFDLTEGDLLAVFV
nr:zinc finger CCCH domain-containing protein 25-like [Tanacetum cinerariifolium]